MLQKLQHLLIPGFLRRLDHYLLLNYRLLWISKIHYVAFYSILSMILLWIIPHLLPLHVDSMYLRNAHVYIDPPLSLKIGDMCLWLAMIPPAGWWAWRQLSYNPVKYFGQTTGRMALAQAAVYLACGGMLAGVHLWGQYWMRWNFMLHFDPLAQPTDIIVFDINYWHLPFRLDPMPLLWMMLFVFPAALMAYQYAGVKHLLILVGSSFLGAISGTVMIGISYYFVLQCLVLFCIAMYRTQLAALSQAKLQSAKQIAIVKWTNWQMW